MKSNKPVLEEKKVFGKRMFIFPLEYASEIDPVTHKRAMLISINGQNTYVICGEPVDVSYDVWMLLKNIGRIGRVVAVNQDETPK